MVKLFDQVAKPNNVRPPEKRRLALTCSELYFAWPTGSAIPVPKLPPKKTPPALVSPVYCGYGRRDWYSVLAPFCEAKFG